MSTKQILIDEDTVKLALEVLERVNNFNDFFDLLDPVLSDLVVDTIDAVKEALAQSRSDVKQDPKPFGYTLEETMKCWDLGYAAAVKALAKKEQPYADKAASVSNDRIKIDPVTGNVQIGTSKQEQSAEHVGEPVAPNHSNNSQNSFETRMNVGFGGGAQKQEQGEPVALEQAPENSLPTWSECDLIIQNDDFRKRAEAGLEGQVLDTPRTTPVPTELHRFIHEYDDADPYRSAWFLHRLECVLKEATTPYVPTGRQQRPFIKPLTDVLLHLFQEWKEDHLSQSNYIDAVEQIKAAHGIKE